MLNRRRLVLTAAAALLAPALAVPARAQAVFADGGLALRGYDPVAYFTDGIPTRGKPEHALTWMGAQWRFASAANRDAFAQAPERYAPQYGGYCAWAVSQGYLAPVDPAQWRIVDGRLYLNATAGVQRRWLRDIPGHIARADSNWPGLRPGE